jgi:hypothetical protein
MQSVARARKVMRIPRPTDFGELRLRECRDVSLPARPIICEVASKPSRQATVNGPQTGVRGAPYASPQNVLSKALTGCPVMVEAASWALPRPIPRT